VVKTIGKEGTNLDDQKVKGGSHKLGRRIKKKLLSKSGKLKKKSKLWIINKKIQQRKKNEDVRTHSKYTGRKRKIYF
jgi:hypothetical protein